MTVTAEQAKAMLDDRTPTTRLINEAYEGGLLVELDIEARHHANSVQQLAATVVELYERLAIVESVQQLAATVVELYERLAIVESERDKLARWKAEAKDVLAGWNQLWEDSGRPGALGESTSAATAKHITALQAAIDKVLALPLMNHKTECKHCGHFTDTFAADTEAIRVALTQGGEG